MNKVIRCIEGHIFEVEKGPNCPVCGAPTSFAAAKAEQPSRPADVEPAASTKSGGDKPASIRRPVVFAMIAAAATGAALLAGATVLWKTPLARAQLPDSDLSVVVGQTLDEVKVAYRLGDVKPQVPATGSSTYSLSAPDQGLNFWFDLNTNRLEAIGVYQPFHGRVLGLHVQDTLEKLKATLGEPNETAKSERDLFYWRPGWSNEVRFIIADGKVQGIMVYPRELR